jgi:hypothetical protein
MWQNPGNNGAKGFVRKSFLAYHPRVYQRQTALHRQRCPGHGPAAKQLMQNTIGAIMGSNIGATLTAWIVATI